MSLLAVNGCPGSPAATPPPDHGNYRAIKPYRAQRLSPLWGHHQSNGGDRPDDAGSADTHLLNALHLPAVVLQDVVVLEDVRRVGGDVLRAVETSVTTKREITAYEGWTNKFIFPPYDFCIPDALITNFQLPQSTMLMFVAAFGGYDTVMKAYETAVKEKYRFGGYGDAMLII